MGTVLTFLQRGEFHVDVLVDGEVWRTIQRLAQGRLIRGYLEIEGTVGLFFIFNEMWEESAVVVGNDALVFSKADAGGEAADDPTAEQDCSFLGRWQLKILLVNWFADKNFLFLEVTATLEGRSSICLFNKE